MPQIFSLQNDPLNYNSFFSACILTYTPKIIHLFHFIWKNDYFYLQQNNKPTITNALGQTVLIQEIDGKATIELPQGLYFVKLGGATQKVVVE